MTRATPLRGYPLAMAATAVLAGCSDNQSVLAPKGALFVSGTAVFLLVVLAAGLAMRGFPRIVA
jgi:hypothetical protein